jgi:hypothetical protein
MIYIIKCNNENERNERNGVIIVIMKNGIIMRM